MKVADILSADKENQAAALAAHVNQIRRLEVALSEEKTRRAKEVRERDEVIAVMKAKYDVERAQVLAYAKIEAKVAGVCIKKLRAELAKQKEELHGIKNVLRIPRLYNIFQDAMRAAASNEVMAEFAQHQLSRITKTEEAPNEMDYKNAVTKALRLTAGPNFPVERLYDQVTNKNRPCISKQPDPPAIPANVDLSHSFIQALDLQGESKPPTATLSGVLSSLSSPTAPQPNYINIIYQHGASDANNGQGFQPDQWEGSNKEDSADLVRAERVEKKGEWLHWRKAENDAARQGVKRARQHQTQTLQNPSRLVLNEYTAELVAMRAGSPKEAESRSAYFQ